MIHLVTGGSGSGKSEYAENWLTGRNKKDGTYIYIATMQPYTEETMKKIERPVSYTHLDVYKRQEGGLSILGTTGIVNPMSEQALIDTIEVEMKVCLAEKYRYLIIAPGNYGLDFLKEQYSIEENDVVKCSNYIGPVSYTHLFLGK